jgi:hypothetical protein
MSLNAILVSLLVAPHLGLGIAWAFWARTPSSSRFQPLRWRTILLSSGLFTSHRDFLGVFDLAEFSSEGSV